VSLLLSVSGMCIVYCMSQRVSCARCIAIAKVEGASRVEALPDAKHQNIREDQSPEQKQQQ
jgi:hypothetical protein